MRMPARLLLLILSAAFLPAAQASDADYQGFHERELMRALVEADLAWLHQGGPNQVLANKLFGVEVYDEVSRICAGPAPGRQAVLRRLKWIYLAEVLALPAATAAPGRAHILASADHADDDARLLVERHGCESPVVRRILQEVGS